MPPIPILLALCAFCSTDPFGTAARAHVLVFARTDCPITQRYAPELQRLGAEFARSGVDLWLVYPDASEHAQQIQKQLAEYKLSVKWTRDPKHELVKRAHVHVAPEAAVFDAREHLVYHGRIDDRWVDFGKSRPAPTVHDLENAVRAVLAGTPVASPETKVIGCSLADIE